jgi:sugar lactone lactonase YvrE
VNDYGNALIRSINLSSLISSTVIGNFGTYATINNSWTSGALGQPYHICIDSVNKFLYFADRTFHRVRKVNMQNGNVSSVAGSGVGTIANGVGSSASFNSPAGICIDSTDTNLYVSEFSNNMIRKIVIASQDVTVVAGSGTATIVDAVGTFAGFRMPVGICIDKSDNYLYIADQGNNRIRKIEISSKIVTTLAGAAFGHADGIGTNALFQSPQGIAIDNNDYVYVADQGSNRIRMISPMGIVSTIAGSLATITDGLGTTSAYTIPSNVWVNKQGTLLRTLDSGAHLIRNINILRITSASSVSLPSPISSSEPVYIAKYDSSGYALYAVTLNGTGAKTTISGAAVDSAKNWYIVGTYTGTPTLSSAGVGVAITLPSALSTNAIYVAEYNADGVPQMAMKIDRVNGANASIGVDTNGNIFICGQYDSSGQPPILYNASGVQSSVILPTLATSVSAPASFLVKYSSMGVPLYANALYGVRLNKLALDPTAAANTSVVVASGNYGSTTVTLYNTDGTIYPTNIPVSVNGTNSGIIVKYGILGNPIDAFAIDSSGSVIMNDVKVDSAGNIYGSGNYVNTPQIYNNRGALVNSVLPNISAGFFTKYMPRVRTAFNLVSTLMPSQNAFVKYITNASASSTTINVKQGDAASSNVATYTLAAGATASFTWFDKWIKIT